MVKDKPSSQVAKERLWSTLHDDKEEVALERKRERIRNQAFVDDVCSMTPEEGVEMMTQLNEGPVEDRKRFAHRIDRVFLAKDTVKPERFDMAIVLLKSVLKNDYLDE